MKSSSRYADTLSRAQETLGGRQRLAEFLDVAPEQLDAWLDGEEAPPLDVLVTALDVIRTT